MIRDGSKLYSVMRKAFTYMALLAISFSMFPTSAYADYVSVTNTEFYEQVKACSVNKVKIIAGSISQGYTEDQTTEINLYKNSIDMETGSLIEFFIQGEDLNLGPTYYGIYKTTIGPPINPYLPVYLQMDNISLELLGGKKASGVFRRIETDGTTYGEHSYMNLNIDLSNPPAKWANTIIYDNGMDFYNIDEGLIIKEANMKNITIPAGYAVSFLRKNEQILNSNTFNFYTNYINGVPVLVLEINKGTYYNVQNGYPTAGQVVIGNYSQLAWDIERNAIGLVKALRTEKQLDLQVGQSVTFFNPLTHFYLPTKGIQNGPFTITYPANAYAVKLYSIVTSDQNGFIVDGITNSTYQPYDPSPSDPNDNEVEIVDSRNPDYIDTTDPNYVEPDLEDEDYTPPPVVIPTTPPTGGNLAGQDPGTFIPNEEDGVIGILKQTLDGLVESMRNIYRPGVGAIQGLVQSGQSFMEAVAEMFTWLPSEVTSVISSALILFIVIGVAKLLV